MNALAKFEVVTLPKLYAVGKEIRHSDEALNRGDNRLPAFWDKCRKEGIFAPLESQAAYVFNSAHAGIFLDWHLGDGDFSYIVGMLMKEGVIVPEGYFSRALPATDAALCWVKCKSVTETRTVPFGSTAKAVKKSGRGCANMKWCADLYHPSRSVAPDKKGYVILDCIIPLD